MIKSLETEDPKYNNEIYKRIREAENSLLDVHGFYRVEGGFLIPRGPLMEGALVYGYRKDDRKSSIVVVFERSLPPIKVYVTNEDSATSAKNSIEALLRDVGIPNKLIDVTDRDIH